MEDVYINVKSHQVWIYFLIWYESNIGEYEWHPITVADRVNVYDQNKILIAYKCFGGINGEIVNDFYIKKDELERWENEK